MRKPYLVLIFLFLLARSVSADTLILKNGQKITGKIITIDNEVVVINPGFGVDVTYYRDEIKDVQQDREQKPDVLPPPQTYDNEENINITYNGIVNNASQGQIKNFFDSTALTEISSKIKNKIRSGITHAIDKHKAISQIVNRFNNIIESLNGKIQSNKINKPLLFASVLGGVIVYIGWGFMMMILANRVHSGSYWMAWVFPFQFFLPVRMSNKSFVWMILALIPFIHIIFWMKICEFLKKPSWLGILIIFPFLNLFLLLYLTVTTGLPKPKKPKRF